MTETITRLKQELDPKLVKEREAGFGKKKLSYIAGWVAETQMNEVFDFKWSRETVYQNELYRKEYQKTDSKGNVKDMFTIGYSCKVKVSVKIESETITKDGIGFGNGISSSENVEQAYELAIKEAETDAFKRAVKSFGTRFGIKLYDADIDISKEYQVGFKSDIAFRDAEDSILNAKTVEEVGVIFKSYEGNYKNEISKLCVLRKNELKGGK